jgi:hypothetical protein
MEDVLRELTEFELDTVSGGAAAAAATTSGDNALAAANTGPSFHAGNFALPFCPFPPFVSSIIRILENFFE